MHGTEIIYSILVARCDHTVPGYSWSLGAVKFSKIASRRDRYPFGEGSTAAKPNRCTAHQGIMREFLKIYW